MTSNATIASGTVITASGNSPVQNVPTVIGSTIGVGLNVTAVAGTSPSLTAAIQWSFDGTNFFAASPADTFSAITAVGGAVQAFTVKAPFWRLAYTVSGTTPSFTLTANAFYA